ncbi:MAG: hypothetical protein IKD75_00345, partial [Prevotella sp.]|nr:hypothetical protein [Prevotella sp.]
MGKAIGTCYALLTHLQRVMMRLRIPDNKYTDDIKNVVRMINSLKAWRGSVVRDHNACEHSLRAMDATYASLFPPHQEQPKRSRRALIVQTNRNINAEELYCLTH